MLRNSLETRDDADHDAGPRARVRSLLRRLDARVVRIAGDDDAFRAIRSANDPRISDALDGAAAPNRISVDDAADVAAMAIRAVEQRLSAAGVRRPENALGAAYGLAVGALADGELFAAAELDLTPALTRRSSGLAAAGFDAFTTRRIRGALLAGDSRVAAIELAPAAFGCDAREAARLARVPLSQRPPLVSPDWTAQFQEPDRPIQFWFDTARGGLQLFIVYYTARCSYGLCMGCALPKLAADALISPAAMFRQTELVLDHMTTEQERAKVSTLVLSNNGSVLDEPTFPQAALLHTLVRAAETLPNLRTISLETRVEFVRETQLRAIRTTLDSVRDGLAFELAVGVEIFDEKLRNRVARKGLSNRGLARLADMAARCGAGLRCYFMLKPLPDMSDDDAFDDLARGLDYFDAISRDTGVPVVVHVNPTYAALGTELEAAFKEGRFVPPDLRRLEALLSARKVGSAQVHLGLNDEGLAVEGGSFLRPDVADAARRLRRFNALQDPSQLHAGTGGGTGAGAAVDAAE